MDQGTLLSFFKIKELRDKIFYTLLIILIYRIGTFIPIPGINLSVLKSYFNSNQSSATGGIENLINFLSGGAFKNFSVFMLGVMPYISMSIIMQVLLLLFPALKKASEDDGGRKKIQSYTRIGTIFVCIIQSFTVSFYADQIPDVISISPIQYKFISIVTVTTGTMFLMWLGEQINQRGIGNGMSLIIFAGIVARIPDSVLSLLEQIKIGSLNPIFAIITFIMFVLVIYAVVYEQKGQRKISVYYARRVVGKKEYQGGSTYIPFKINPSGVIPIIFASSILLFPMQIASSLGSSISWLQSVANFLSPNRLPYMILYVLLIVFFAYFYSQVTLNPIEISRQLRENGGNIPEAKGKRTEEFLSYVLNRILLPGSFFLAFIAIVPNLIISLFSGFPQNLAYLMGGTSLLIIVGVDLDFMSQIESHLKMYKQDGNVIKKGKLKGKSL